MWSWVVGSYRCLLAELPKGRWLPVCNLYCPWTGKKNCVWPWEHRNPPPLLHGLGYPDVGRLTQTQLPRHTAQPFPLCRGFRPHAFQMFKSICRLALSYPGLNLALPENGGRWDSESLSLKPNSIKIFQIFFYVLSSFNFFLHAKLVKFKLTTFFPFLCDVIPLVRQEEIKPSWLKERLRHIRRYSDE